MRRFVNVFLGDVNNHAVVFEVLDPLFLESLPISPGPKLFDHRRRVWSEYVNVFDLRAGDDTYESSSSDPKLALRVLEKEVEGAECCGFLAHLLLLVGVGFERKVERYVATGNNNRRKNLAALGSETASSIRWHSLKCCADAV